MQRIEELKWISADILIDILAPVVSFQEFYLEKQYDPDDLRQIGFQRMCINSVIMALSKLFELINAYGKEINELPEPLRTEIQDLRKIIESKKIYQFRSKYIGHVFDDDAKPKRPLNRSEAESRLAHIIGFNYGDLINFFEWVSPKEDTSGEKGVVGCIQRLKAYCLDQVGSSERP